MLSEFELMHHQFILYKIIFAKYIYIYKFCKVMNPRADFTFPIFFTFQQTLFKYCWKKVKIKEKDTMSKNEINYFFRMHLVLYFNILYRNNTSALFL